MELKGTVRWTRSMKYGVHQDGLVHISVELSDRFVHPLDVVKVGVVNVSASLSADEAKENCTIDEEKR